MKGVKSDQTQVFSGRCKIHVSWTVPDGFLAHEIQHFMVYVNDTQVYNESLGNETIAMRTYNVCTCDIHEIKIFAVDACGNIGKNYSLFTAKKLEPLPDSELECEGKTSLTTPNHRGIDVRLIIIVLINNNNILLHNSDIQVIVAIIGWLAFGVVLILLIIITVTVVLYYRAQIRKINTKSSRSTDSDREVELVGLII